MEVSVHPRLQDWDTPEFIELGGVGVVIEGTSDQNVKCSITGLTSG